MYLIVDDLYSNPKHVLPHVFLFRDVRELNATDPNDPPRTKKKSSSLSQMPCWRSRYAGPYTAHFYGDMESVNCIASAHIHPPSAIDRWLST
jgi:hypothetical protein